jgi:hypothetical protein
MAKHDVTKKPEWTFGIARSSLVVKLALTTRYFITIPALANDLPLGISLWKYHGEH